MVLTRMDASTHGSLAIHGDKARSGYVYDEWYFERKYGYSKKKHAIQRHYLSIIKWGNQYTRHDLLNGSNKMALDVGCAYGFVVSLLRRLGYEAFGIDISKYAVTKGEELSECDLLLSDAQYLPFKASSFDLITCFELLEHLPRSITAISRIYKILKPGGTLIMTTPNVGIIAVIINTLSREPASAHPSVKPPNDWIETLSYLRFSEVKFESFLLLPIPPTFFNKYFIVKCPLHLSSHIKILATKALIEENNDE